MESPDKVVIPFNAETINKKDRHIFGIGIRNDLDNIDNFGIEIGCKAGYRKDKTAICEAGGCSGICSDWGTPGQSIGINIPKNDRKIIKLFFIVPRSAESGNYIFDVRVTCTGPATDCDPYDNIKKLYVTVK